MNSVKRFVKKNRAFTLIEVIVVMALMSILLYFAIPRLDIDMFSNDDRDVSTWLIVTVKSLKETSQQEGIQRALCVDLDNNMMWSGVKSDSLTQEAPPKENQYKMPEGIALLDVEFPGIQQKSSGIVEIYFYPKGYSDKAIIHIRDKNHNRHSFVIEPFLTEVKIYDRYIEF
jgi:prepilin-type N-terminal cleavage/methylation domain-containing protein